MYKFKISYIVSIVIACLLLSCSKGAKSVLEKAEDATFVIYTFDEHGSPAGSGSGFFIDKDGIGITNYHVLDKSMKAVIKLKNGQEYEIDKVLASDKKWDIAKFSILNEDKAKFSYLEFSNKDIEQGDKVYNLGAPMGLEQTFADGLVSSIRSDSHGQVAQVTLPISSGSSGSPIMNESGEVVAVATYKSARGENLNFGVFINEEKLSLMKANPFVKTNRQFNNKEGFIILNITSDQDNDLVLNALQFKSDATIAYMSYTNLDMSMNGSEIWCPTDYGDKGFYIEDKANGKKYYVVSSTLSSNNDECTSVPLATVCKFQVNFPAINKSTNRITVSEGGNPKWSFSDIDLNDYRKSVKIDFENYQKEYAYSTMQEGQLEYAQAIFEDILDEDPEDIQALNAMGIISYAIDNNQDAIKYFTEVIENHPNSSSGYLNRSCVYKYQRDSERAIQDLSKAISIDGGDPNLYMERADLYAGSKNWDKAKADIEKVLSFDNSSSSVDVVSAYYKKGLCNIQLGDNRSATMDLEKALNYASDSETKQAILSTLEEISPQHESSYGDSSNSASSYFTGNIGPFPITLYLKVFNDGSVQGWYYYNSRGPAHKFALTGAYSREGRIVINEYTQKGNNTGKFDGNYSDGVYSGTFYALADSKSYDFYLNEM
jgi:serine protease Do